MKNQENSASASRLIPLSKWPEFHPWPTAPALRYYVYNAKLNGFEKHSVVVRIGRRILIDEAAFFRWCNSVGRSTPQGAA